jgi:hypothetical protein
MRKLKQSTIFGILSFILLFGFIQVQIAQNVGDTIFETSFEEGNDSTGLPIGTEGPYDWNGNGADATADNTVAHTGTYSVKIYHPVSDTLDIDCSLDVPFEGNEERAKYECTVWIKTELTVGDAQIITAWDNNRIIRDITGTTDWTEYKFEFEGPGTAPAIRLHINHGLGTVWYDDLKIVKIEDAIFVPDDEVANAGFELPNDEGTGPIWWYPQPWGSGSSEIGFPGNDTARYVWDNTTAKSGEYSAKIQVTQADVDRGSMDAGWMTNNLKFISGGVYEFSYWVKTANFTANNYARISIGYNNLDLSMVRENTDWVQVKDTLIFPTDQDENGWRNDMRFRLSGRAVADTMAEVWFDDVAFTFLGQQADQLDSITVYEGDNNSVNISWPAHSQVAGAVYHVMMQPVSENGVFENNILTNPGFEEPNDDGSAPKDWMFRPDAWAAEPVGEFPADETYDGNFSVWFGELDPSDERGVYGRWMQTFDNSNMKYHEAYMYGAMVKYEDVVALQDSIIDPNHPNGYYYSCGVNIWYDRYGFQFQNYGLVELGWSTPTGTSDGWVQIGLPLIYDQAAARHNIGFGLGQYWEGLAKGSLYIDNAFVVPFEEVTTTTSTEITLEDVPEGVKYFAIYVEDPSGEMIVSPAKIGVIKQSPVSVENYGPVPAEYELQQNYPNPFNPSTTINFGLKVDSDVSLKVFNILGQEVATLINKNVKAGLNKIEFTSSSLSSGVYFYRLEANGADGSKFVDVKKMMFMK